MKSNELRQIFNIPAIYAHEFAHILACILLFIPIFEININYKAEYSYVRYMRPNHRISNIIINLAPFIIHILFIALAFINILFIIAVIYLLLAYSVSLPSEQDYRNIREFKAYGEEIN